MNEKCPSCGNYVEGKRLQSYTKKVTKTGVKSIVNGAASVGAASTGAAIGTAICPGVGTLVGAGAGFVASAMFHTAVNDGIDKVVDVAEENLLNIVYEFTCPKCGCRWTSKGNASSSSNNKKISASHCSPTNIHNKFDWYSKFFQDYECYKDDRGNILSTKESVKEFIDELYGNMQDCKDKEIRGHYYFLFSFICLQYSMTNWSDNLFEYAWSNIKLALSNDDNDEYKLLSTIISIAKIDIIESSSISILNNLNIDIDAIQTELINNEYWKFAFENVLFNKICIDFFPFYNETGDHLNLLKVLFAYDFKDIGYKIAVYNKISQVYKNMGDYSKQYEYTKAAVELADFEKEFDNENFDHFSWLDALENLGICYEEGRGVEKNPTKAFEIFMRCAKLGSGIAMSACGEMYENGEGVEQNLSMALDRYNRALALGYEKAEENLKRVLEKLGIEKQYSGPYIPQKEEFYMDVEDVFVLTDRGVVITGQVKTGCINIGDRIILINKHNNYYKVCQIAGIEMLRKLLDCAEFGDNVGILLKGVDNCDEIKRGTFVTYFDETKVADVSKSSFLSEQNEYTADEMAYLDELKACLEEDGEISSKERRLLERYREKLGISAERAKELEVSLSAPQLTEDELEYLEEYKACLEEDGEISAKERRLLNRLREKLGITEERAEELEKLS